MFPLLTAAFAWYEINKTADGAEGENNGDHLHAGCPRYLLAVSEVQFLAEKSGVKVDDRHRFFILSDFMLNG